MVDDPAAMDGSGHDPVRFSGPEGVAVLRRFQSLGGLAAAVEDGGISLCVAAGYALPDAVAGAEVLLFPLVTLRAVLDGLGKVSARLEEVGRTDAVVAAECSLIARELSALRRDMAALFSEVSSHRREDLQANLARSTVDRVNLAETRARLEDLEEHNRSAAGSPLPDLG